MLQQMSTWNWFFLAFTPTNEKFFSLGYIPTHQRRKGPQKYYDTILSRRCPDQNVSLVNLNIGSGQSRLIEQVWYLDSLKQQKALGYKKNIQ